MDADKNFHCSYQPSNLVSFLRLNEKYDVNRKALWREKHFSSKIKLSLNI